MCVHGHVSDNFFMGIDLVCDIIHEKIKLKK
jgi:hypothetical protein